MKHTIAQALALAVVDEVMVDMVTLATDEKDSVVAECGYLAVIDLQAGLFGGDAS